jgi:hypothetical protein
MLNIEQNLEQNTITLNAISHIIKKYTKISFSSAEIFLENYEEFNEHNGSEKYKVLLASQLENSINTFGEYKDGFVVICKISKEESLLLAFDRFFQFLGFMEESRLNHGVTVSYPNWSRFIQEHIVVSKSAVFLKDKHENTL